MVIEYRGRQLNIKDKLIEDYNRFHNVPFSNIEIDIYIYNQYIWNRDREHEIPQVAASLTDNEIIEVIEKALKRTNGIYYLDLHYGEKL